MAQDIGNIYNTQIPAFDENADIQTALRLYHYGEDTDTPSPLISNSVAGHLSNLEETKIDKVPVTINNNANLNDFVTSGYYINTSTGVSGDAISGLNFPIYFNNLGAAEDEYAGMLKVVNSGTVVLQEYHMIGSTSKIINRSFWRLKYQDSWSDWVRFYSRADILEMGDARYLKQADGYTRTYIDSNFAPKKLQETAIPVGTTAYTLVAGDVTKIVSMFSGGTLTVPTDSVNIPIGTIINVYNGSATQFLEIAGATGVTVRNPGTIEPYQEASLRKRAANEWVASGPVY